MCHILTLLCREQLYLRTKSNNLPISKSDIVPTIVLKMVLTSRETTQRRWIADNQFNKPFSAEANNYQLQRHHHPTVYNDLNLFNPPANVNVVHPQPPQSVSHISSNGYYGFVHIHQDNDSAIDTIENEASMDCTEEIPNYNTRKRGFEIEPQFVDGNALKKCRLNYEGT